MSILLPHKPDTIPQPFVVVCEGFSDAQFVVSLLSHVGIQNCNVGCPSRAGGFADGKDAIPQYLKAVAALLAVGKAALTGILVVADTDGDATAIFNALASGLANAGFHRPPRPFHIEGKPIRSGVFLIPGAGRTGTLEHILWDAAIQQHPNARDCVEEFAKCMGDALSPASENERAKMKMSALVALSCRTNPWASAAMIWKDSGNPVPIESPCFQPVTDFLRAFVQ
jgi:hypothetical protein